MALVMQEPFLFSETRGALLVECYRFSDTSKTAERFILVTEDTGMTWETNEFPGRELLFIDELNAFALGNDIAFSENQGQDWTRVKRVRWQGQFSFVDENYGWAVATHEDEIALVRTMNGGQTWTEIEPRISSE